MKTKTDPHSPTPPSPPPKRLTIIGKRAYFYDPASGYRSGKILRYSLTRGGDFKNIHVRTFYGKKWIPFVAFTRSACGLLFRGRIIPLPSSP